MVQADFIPRTTILCVLYRLWRDELYTIYLFILFKIWNKDHKKNGGRSLQLTLQILKYNILIKNRTNIINAKVCEDGWMDGWMDGLLLCHVLKTERIWRKFSIEIDWSVK